MPQVKKTNLRSGVHNIPKWLMILSVSLIGIILIFIVLNETIFTSSQNMIINTTVGQDQKPTFSQTVETSLQNAIDPNYQKKLGVLPDLRWYWLKIKLETFGGYFYGSDKRDSYYLNFCRRRLEESFLLYQIDKKDLMSKSLVPCVKTVNTINKSRLMGQSSNSENRRKVSNLFSLIVALNQDQTIRENSDFHDVYKLVQNFFLK
ncbi:MAG: hypothetical protein WCP93_02805 [Candidatus Berkelbacteria bacterium]